MDASVTGSESSPNPTSVESLESPKQEELEERGFLQGRVGEEGYPTEGHPPSSRVSGETNTCDNADGPILGAGGIFGYGHNTSKFGISSYEKQSSQTETENAMSGQDEDDLVEDSFNVINVKHSPLSSNVQADCLPTNIPVALHQKQNPEDIRIVHQYADDMELGDSFGAKLDSTDYHFQDKLFCQHMFIEVEPSTPASTLGLTNKDELVMLNEVFVPELTRKQVYGIFRKLPVDSRTTLTMVIRRIESGEKFDWIQISCILVPEYEKEPKRRLPPECKHVKTQTLEHGPDKEFIIKLELGGRYLCVDQQLQHPVCLKKITDEKIDQESDLGMFPVKKRLQVANMTSDKHPGYEWITALKAPVPSQKYIGPNMNLAVALLPEEHWYNYERDSNGVYFIHKDPKRGTFYLGRQDEKVTFVTSKFLCQVFEVKQDQVDGGDDLTESAESLSLTTGRSSSPGGRSSTTSGYSSRSSLNSPTNSPMLYHDETHDGS